MHIKKNTKRHALIQMLFQIMTRRYLVIILVFFCLSALSVSSIYYGGYLYKTRGSVDLVDMARGAFNLKFKVLSNYLDGLSANPNVFIIDIRNNEYQKLAYLRQVTLDSGDSTLSEEVKSQTVSGKIHTFGIDDGVKVNFSLTGQNFDHIGSPDKWSLRVDVKGKNLFHGMEKFTLLIPTARSREPLTEWLNHRLEASLGLISLRYNFVRVVLNGKDLGIYAFEEFLDKRLLERNHHREGLIVRPDKGGLKVYKYKKVKKDPNMLSQSKYLQSLWRAFKTEDIPTSILFDVQKLAKYYAMTDLVNGHHSHFQSNEFFYFNPITRLLEPIGREWSSPYKRPEIFKLFIENKEPSGTPRKKRVTNFHIQVFKDVKFVTAYFEELRKMTTDTFVSDFIESQKSGIEEARTILNSEYPYRASSENYLKDKISYIRAFLEKDHSQKIAGYLNRIADGKHELMVQNASVLPMTIDALHVGSKKSDVGIAVPANSTITVPIDDAIDEANMQDIEISLSVPGIYKTYNIKAFPWSKASALSANRYPIPNSMTPMIKPDAQGQFVLEGNSVDLSENLVIPEGHSLLVKAGTRINLTNNAMILSYGPIRFEGTKQNPIHLFSSDKTGAGIVVLKAGSLSTLSYTEFNWLTAFQSPNWAVTAPIVFYESDVDISHSIFKGNNSEDSLNIVRSKFSITGSLFSDIASDAFDSDFSEGTIKDTRFEQLGNDAIDISGSKIEAEGIQISGARDKGISIGEDSEFVGLDIVIRESGIAVSSKDSSTFNIMKLNIYDSEVGFALFRKKPEFGPTDGEVSQLTIQNIKKDFLIEMGSSLRVDDRMILGDLKDVKGLMYGAVYGEKTVR